MCSGGRNEVLKHYHYKIIMQYNKHTKICLFMNITNLIHRIPYVILYKIAFKKYCTITCICSCTSKHCSYYSQSTQFCKIKGLRSCHQWHLWSKIKKICTTFLILLNLQSTHKQTNTFHRSKIYSTMTEYEIGQNNTWCSYTTSSQDTN